MIFLYTGVPGAGKTLFCLRDMYDFWKKDAVAKTKELKVHEGEWINHARPVFVSRVNELAVPGWTVLENPADWHKCPVGAIILMDECQEDFPPRPNGSQVPEHVARIADHRHRAQDLFLITQHPSSIDAFVRRRLEQTNWINRKFGSKLVTFYSWPGVVETPEKSKKSGFKRDRLHPKECFSWYKSAEAHTHQFRLPREAYYFAGAAILIPLLGYALLQVMYRLGLKKEEKLENAVTLAKEGGVSPVQTAPLLVKRSGPESTADYLASMVPRVGGLPHTAPAYDRLTQSVRVPVPAACIESSSVCKCWSQSATPMPVDDGVCRQIVRGGFYVAFDTELRRDDRARPLPVNAPEPVQRHSGYQGLPESDLFVGVPAGPPVLSYDRQQMGTAKADTMAGPVVDQAQGIGRGRVVQ